MLGLQSLASPRAGPGRLRGVLGRGVLVRGVLVRGVLVRVVLGKQGREAEHLRVDDVWRAPQGLRDVA